MKPNKTPTIINVIKQNSQYDWNQSLFLNIATNKNYLEINNPAAKKK